MQPTDCLCDSADRVDAAAVSLVEVGVAGCAPLPSFNLVPFGRWRHARGRKHCCGEPGSTVSGGYAPDLVRMEAA